MDFEHMLPQGPQVMFGGHWIATRDKTPHGSYLQDHTGTDSVHRTRAHDSVHVDANDKYLLPLQAAKKTQLDALLWPYNVVVNGDFLPLVAAAGTAFFVFPYVDPSMSIFMDLALGYLVGGMVFYMENRDNAVPK